MNLHEECLLKYLLNPVDLSNSTELLKLHNSLIEEGVISNRKTNLKAKKHSYNTTKI